MGMQMPELSHLDSHTNAGVKSGLDFGHAQAMMVDTAKEMPAPMANTREGAVDHNQFSLVRAENKVKKSETETLR